MFITSSSKGLIGRTTPRPLPPLLSCWVFQSLNLQKNMALRLLGRRCLSVGSRWTAAARSQPSVRCISQATTFLKYTEAKDGQEAAEALLKIVDNKDGEQEEYMQVSQSGVCRSGGLYCLHCGTTSCPHSPTIAVFCTRYTLACHDWNI